MARASRPTRPERLFPLLLTCLPALSGCMSLAVQNINMLGGFRLLDQGDWEPVDSPMVVGIETDAYKLGDGIGGEVGVLYSRDSGDALVPNLGTAQIDSETWELYLGARKTFPIRETPFYPYVSGGLTFLRSEYQAKLVDGTLPSTDETFGFYVRGGAYWNFVENWHLGIDVRRIFGTSLDVLGVPVDLDYGQVLFFIGFAF